MWNTTLCSLPTSLYGSSDVLWTETSQRPANDRSAVTLLQAKWEDHKAFSQWRGGDRATLTP